MKRLLHNLLVALPTCLFAQDSTKAITSFSFEDVDSTPIKVYCTQKVLNQSPNKFISIGYDYQSASTFTAKEWAMGGNRKFNALQGLKINVNAPIISTNKIIVNLGAQYARTAFTSNNQGVYPLYPLLVDNGLHTAGLGTTIFKPLNQKNFIIVQANTDANWLADNLQQLKGNALTFSATALYGWKKSESEMFGIGASRTYRLGRLIYVPVVLYNKTFNNNWGVEVTFPARAHVRRNINPKSLLQLGYELEGNQYSIYTSNNNQLFLQRGEIKPRLIYERSLFGFWWLNIQAGYRINGRFNVVNKYDGKEADEIITNTLTNALYFNVSVNLVSL